MGRAGFAGATWVRPVGRDGGASGGQAGGGICCRTLSMHRPAKQGFRGPDKAANQQQETGTSRRGPGSPLPPPRYSDAPPPPGRHTPPQTHVLPGPPLVTLVLTYINPISHTRTDWLGTHPGTPGQRRPPKRPFLSLMPLSQHLEQGGDPGRSVNTRSASPKATISHNNIPTSPHCRPVPSGHTRTT